MQVLTAAAPVDAGNKVTGLFWLLGGRQHKGERLANSASDSSCVNLRRVQASAGVKETMTSFHTLSQ